MLQCPGVTLAGLGIRNVTCGLQVVEEKSVVFSTIEVRVKRTGDLGDGIAYTAGRSRERTAHLSTWQRPKQDSCLTNSSLHSLASQPYFSSCACALGRGAGERKEKYVWSLTPGFRFP